uniref:Knottin scorpion toxin-like domain-containing protein n=3 Tax=Oryza TaxID=4527 RepID=A0A0D3F1B1_9ORYZ
MACKVASIFASILILSVLVMSCDAAGSSCPTVRAPNPTCLSPQICANQCVAAGYLIGFCEFYGSRLGDCVCAKCTNAVQAGRPPTIAPTPAVRRLIL